MSSSSRVPAGYKGLMFESMVRRGGLLVAAAGLGVRDVLVKCIQLHCTPRGTVFVMRASHDAERILRALEDAGVARDRLPRVLNSTTSTTSEREKLYLEGGCFLVTPRILVKDMLQKRVQPRSITGFIINAAHGISAASTESFVLRLFREGNTSDDAFVMAFTDEARQTVGGFNKTGKLMEMLTVRNLFLWPRFELAVKKDLAVVTPQVVQLAISLTPRMKTIQTAIVEIMVACTDQLARDSGIDLADITKEVNVLPSANMRLRMKLKKVWNTMKPASRELVADLETLRSLLRSLLTLDSVSFYAILDAVRRTASMSLGMGSRIYHKDPSPWLLLEAADTLFRNALDRVYKMHQVTVSENKIIGSDGAGGSDGSVHKRKRSKAVRRELILERNPKWQVLTQILHEIHASKPMPSSAEKRNGGALAVDAASRVEDDHGAAAYPTVVIFCRDQRTMKQLSSVIEQGEQIYLHERYERFKAEAKRRRDRTSRDGGARGNYGSRNNPRTQTSRNQATTARAAASLSSSTRFRSFGHAMASLGIEDPSSMLSHWWAMEKKQAAQIVERHAQQTPPLLVKPPKNPKSDHVHVCVYDRRSAWNASEFLRSVRAEYAIMYDPDPNLTRELEVYAAEHPAFPFRVYFLVYEGSVEERCYLASVEQERRAFRQLIEHKSLMAETDVAASAGAGAGFNAASRSQHKKTSSTAAVASSSTRKGGGTVLAAGEALENSCVVVDTREFRSALPLMLHQEGIEIIPMTLTVGDYILTPKRCVERKSIPDLFGSLKSGRLYKQAEQMCRHFEQPMLLIEFDDDRDFRLVDDIPREISEWSVQSKLVLVILHFPALHFLWMSSPRQTASCFVKLKVNQDEPEDHIARIAGVDGEDPRAVNVFDSTREDASFVGSQDALRRIPGITASNWKSVTRSVPNLAALASMTVEQLGKILGGKGLARKAYAFFHKEPTGADL